MARRVYKEVGYDGMICPTRTQIEGGHRQGTGLRVRVWHNIKALIQMVEE